MYSNKLRGIWDQVQGFGREFMGEMNGNEQVFSAGHQQRMIGKLEFRNDLSHAEAVQQIRDAERRD